MSLAAFAAHKCSKYAVLPWATFAVTVFFWLVWTTKLRVALTRDETLLDAVFLDWYLPTLLGFVLWYLAQPVWVIVRGTRPLGSFESVVPVLAVAWAYPTARALPGEDHRIALVGLAAGVGLAALGAWVVRRNAPGKRLSNSCMIAALLLLAAALPAVAPNLLISLVIWVLAGLGVFVLALRWESRRLRFVSYLFQMFVAVVAMGQADVLALEVWSPVQAAVLVTLCAVLCLHYAWCRARPFVPDLASSNPFDVVNGLGVVLLLAGVVFGFGALRLTWFEVLQSTQQADGGAFQCGQSVIINAGAIGLALMGLLRRSRELFVIGLLVAGLGAAKVFGYDLTHVQGFPLVLSMLSFGITAALSAMIWRRWQSEHAETNKGEE